VPQTFFSYTYGNDFASIGGSFCRPAMSYLTFQDPDGNRWQVWLVSPQIVDRRRAQRRTRQVAYAAGSERRIVADRRKSGTSRASLLPKSFAGGWLCFESEKGEKRRLYPIPDAWDELTEMDLWKLSQQARRVPRT